MKILGIKKQFVKGFELLAIGVCLSSCVDNSYDLSNDIDLTMGLGSEGLSVKLGTTEKILLENILEVDETVRLDENNLYYLIENGSSDVNFHIKDFKAKINKATLKTDDRVFDYNDLEAIYPSDADGLVSIDKFFKVDGNGKGTTDEFAFSISDAGNDVISVSKIYTKDTKIRIYLDMVQPDHVKFKIRSIPYLKITLPDYLVATHISTGQLDGKTITMSDVIPVEGQPVCDIYAQYIDLGKDGILQDHEVTLPDERNRITMDGTFSFEATENFSMSEKDFADVQLEIVASNSHEVPDEVSINQVVGLFDPRINPETEKIDIAASLPDFLQDESVTIKVANPTIKFLADMEQIPLGLNFSGTLEAVKSGNNNFPKSIRIPEEGKALLNRNETNLLYFCQTGHPYDPVEVAPDATSYQVSNISHIIETLPDYINVDLGNQQIRVNQEEGTITLEKNYHAQMRYDLYVPFEFDKGLKIVYKDSTNSLHDDLEDFQAEGMNITATVLSTIPLELMAEIIPLDINGIPITSIQVQPNIIPASDGHTEKESEFMVDLQLDNPADLQKVDRLLFKVHADGVQTTGTIALSSDQYMLFKDIRLKLKGQVIGNFN